MFDQLAACQQIVEEDLVMILQEPPSEVRVCAELDLRLLRQGEVGQVIVALSCISDTRNKASKQ